MLINKDKTRWFLLSIPPIFGWGETFKQKVNARYVVQLSDIKWLLVENTNEDEYSEK